MNELNFDGQFPCIGQNLFNIDYSPFALIRTMGNEVLLVRDTLVMKFNPEIQSAKFYLIEKNHLLVPISQPDDKSSQESVDFVRDYLQSLSYIYKNGRYRKD